MQNLVVHALHIGVVKGRQARKHLEEQGAEGPPVHRLSVALVLQNLRRQILGCAAEGLGATHSARARDATLSKPEVREADVAGLVQPEK